MEGLRPPTFQEFADDLPVSEERSRQLYPIALMLSRAQLEGWIDEIDQRLEEFSDEPEPASEQNAD